MDKKEMTVKEAAQIIGRRGGQQTLKRHGAKYFGTIRGKNSGRKKKPVIDKR